jgi:hypothetical protein
VRQQIGFPVTQPPSTGTCGSSGRSLRPGVRRGPALPGDVDVPALPGIIGVKQTGRLAVATTNAFDVSLARAYETAGIRVHAVEEIIVTNVHSSREGVAIARS